MMSVMSTTILELRLELGYSYKYASAARDRVCNWIFSHFRRLWCMYPSPSKWITISCGFSLSKHKLIASPSHPKIQTRRVLKANQLQLWNGWIDHKTIQQGSCSSPHRYDCDTLTVEMPHTLRATLKAWLYGIPRNTCISYRRPSCDYHLMGFFSHTFLQSLGH